MASLTDNLSSISKLAQTIQSDLRYAGRGGKDGTHYVWAALSSARKLEGIVREMRSLVKGVGGE
jgi:hypothetical protein